MERVVLGGMLVASATAIAIAGYPWAVVILSIVNVTLLMAVRRLIADPPNPQPPWDTSPLERLVTEHHDATGAQLNEHARQLSGSVHSLQGKLGNIEEKVQALEANLTRALQSDAVQRKPQEPPADD